MIKNIETWLIVCEVITLLCILIDLIRYEVISRKMEDGKNGKENVKRKKKRNHRRNSVCYFSHKGDKEREEESRLQVVDGE